MAYGLVAHTIQSTNVSSTTSAINTTGASLLVVALTNGGGSPPTDVKNNNWTALVSGAGWRSTVQLFYVANPIVGTGHTFHHPSGNGIVAAAAFSGASASPFDQQNHGNSVNGA